VSRVLRYSEDFVQDLNLQTDWYVWKAGIGTAQDFGAAVDHAIQRLVRFPALGVVWDRAESELQGFRFFAVDRPFERFLLFYKVTETELHLERLLHGMRDLPRRFREPPGADWL
jgi:toxin ParE1/3/4